MKKKSIVAAISALSLIVSMNTGIGSVFATVYTVAEFSKG